MRFNKFLLLLLLPLTFHAVAQKEIEDLDSLYAILQRMPSFKAQITGKKAEGYEALYKKLKSEIKPGISDHALFLKLSQLILPVNDMHIDFSQVPKLFFTKENILNKGYMENYRKSGAYLKAYRSTADLKLLEQRLTSTNREELEGIYYNYDDELKVGIYRTKEKGKLEGVVLSSQVQHFEPGEIVLFLEEKENNNLNAWMVSYTNRAMYLNRSERWIDGMLLSSGFRKKPFKKSVSNIPRDPAYLLKRIDTHIQYLKLTDFMATDKNKALARQFYTSIKDSLTASNLIVDLRNNGGGYYSVSSQFLNLLRRYANPGKIYALVNYHTVSNAEQFAIKVKNLPNTMLLGQATMGRITYGQNFGTKYTLPSGKFIITPTDLGGEAMDLPYEGTGVPVAVTLDPTKDWIEQVKEIIKKN